MNISIASHITSIAGFCKKTKMPGTLASFVALIFSVLTYHFFNKIIYFLVFFILLFFGFWAIKKIQEKVGIGDHQWIGIDEFIGMWIANMFLFEFNFNLQGVIIFSVISFVIFRIIDIVKYIPPLATINENEKQTAMPVLLDDIVAGFYTYFIMLVMLGFYNLNFVYSVFLLLLPAMAANMAPVLLQGKYCHKPINEKIFGAHKTWRGFLGAVVVGTVFYVALVKLHIIFFPKSDLGSLGFMGFLFGFGAISGDLIKSFWKRKMGIAPGKSFLPWDQIDYILGMMLLTYPIYLYTLNQAAIMLILGGSLSAVAHRLGYLIKITKDAQ